MRLTILISFLLASLTMSAQDNVLKEYEHLFIEARNENKNVILVFGHKHCGWCRVFDRYHDSPEVKIILEPEYIIHKIDIIESKPGRKLFDFYKLQGTPVWMIFDSKQELLSNGKDLNGNIVGYPLKQTEIDIYLSEIRKTSNEIHDQDLQVLNSKLKEIGNSKNNK